MLKCFLAGIFLFGAARAQSGNAHTSRNSLDWAGTYSGVLPCADCEGLLTIVQLDKNMHFVRKTKYLGKSDSFWVSQGNFSWAADGNQITLTETKKLYGPEKYQVGENTLTLLDRSGQRINSPLADKYILHKEEGTLTNKYWKLVELMGKPIHIDSGFSREPHIRFLDSGHRVAGNGGCNNFSGSYELKQPNRIRFSQMIVTQMACPNMESETQFLKTLQMADSYYVKKDTLILNKARMAPLARFVRVLMK